MKRWIAHSLAIAVLSVGACIPMQPASGGGGGSPSSNPNPGTSELPPGGGGGGGGGGAGAPAPAGPVSVTIRSACRETVKVFYGDKPKFGSGTTSSISSNSVNSHTFQPGDMFWIVDGSDNGVDSITVDDRVRTIEINSDCTSMSLR